MNHALTFFLAFSACFAFSRTVRAAGAQNGKSDKPNIAVLATGGTIASRGVNSLMLTDYGRSTGMQPVDVQGLIAAVPELETFANITSEQVCNIGSSKLSLENWLSLAKRTNELLASAAVDGVVITHGTDTLEETAYFLHLVVKSDKPVVLVGSMLPATGLSADGPINLANAVALAASPASHGRGVMVCLNQQISGAFGVTKTNTTNVAAFKCPDTGYLGHMQDFRPFFLAGPAQKHTYQTEFDVSSVTVLPRVDVNYATLGSDGLLIDAAVAAGARGIVNAGMGHGNMSATTMNSLKEARRKGVTVVVGSRVGSGLVTPTGQFTRAGFVSAMLHNVQKARVLLMLALTITDDVQEIQRMFNEY